MKFLFDNFDILAESPEGIKKLREMILQFAVQGKLVPQDPNDEPASFLLAKIRVEKEMLVKEGKIKKQKPLEPIKPGEIPFELPKGWEFVRLGELSHKVSDGFHHTPRKLTEGIKYISATHINIGWIDWNSNIYVSEKEYLSLLNKVQQAQGDILIVNRGAGCGDAAIVNNNGKFCFQNAAIVGFSQAHLNSEFILAVINNSKTYFVDKFIQGGAQPLLSNRLLSTHIIPVPPLAEQKRIVAKVDSLMALCDELEKQQKEKAFKKLTLNKASLHTLHNSTTKQNFNKNWNHITHNFDLLYSTPGNVKELKQTILQLAVQGKLTEDWRRQNPDVESQEKGILKSFNNQVEIKTGRKKFLKEVNKVIFEDDKIPTNWVKSQFFNFCLLKRGHDLPKSKRKTGHYIVASSGGINGYHNEYIVEEGVVIGRSGSTGKTHYIEEKHWPLNTVLYGEDYCGNNKKYVYLFLKAFDFNMYSSSTAVPTLNRNKFLNELIIIPPLFEQKRIVAKVDSLMALCDRLGENLSEKEKMSGKMLSAVVSGL